MLKKRWFKFFMVAAMLLALLATTMVYLTPLDAYVPEIEQSLSSGLGEPVEIGHLQFEPLPLPHFDLERVKLGKNADAELQSVRAFFDWRSLLSSRYVIKRLEVSHGYVNQGVLQGLLAGGAGAPARVEEIRFEDIRIIAPAFVLGPVEGQVQLNADDSLQRAWVTMTERRVVAMVYPRAQGGYRVEFGARSWVPPGFPRLVLDKLSASGVLAGQQFNVEKLSGETQGVRFAGSGNVSWLPQWQLAVHLDQAEGRIERVLPLLDKRVVATGMLHASGNFSARGETLAALQDSLKFDVDVATDKATLRSPLNPQRTLLIDSVDARLSGTLQRISLDRLMAGLYGGKLTGSGVLLPAAGRLVLDLHGSQLSVQPLAEALAQGMVLTGTLNSAAKCTIRLREFDRYPANVRLAGNFMLRNGMIGKVDLVQAVNNPLKGGGKGGQTHFEQLSGLLSVDGNGYHLSRLKVSSGSANATGKLDISPQLKLDGVLDTELKGTAKLVSMPLKVSGTVSDPVLRPASPVLAGAAVGTALLGPGLGTALGIEVGNLLHKLFGSSDRNKQAAAPDGQAEKNK